MKRYAITLIMLPAAGCATLTNDAMTPVAVSFSDGSAGECRFENKRGVWPTAIPVTVSVRRSDDPLKWDCKTIDGRIATGSMPSTIGAKMIASAVFIDLGITDAITDKSREYPASFVIPVQPRTDGQTVVVAPIPTTPVTPVPIPVSDDVRLP